MILRSKPRLSRRHENGHSCSLAERRLQPQGKETEPTMHNLENSLRLGMTVPVYLFYGEETLLMEQAAARVTALAAPADNGFDREYLRGDEHTPAEVAETADSGSFFAEKKVVLVRDIPWLRPKRKKTEGAEEQEDSALQLEPLLAYIRDPNPATVLILLVNGSVNRNSRLYKAVQASGSCVEFVSPRGGERELWLKNYLFAAGKQASPQVCQYVSLMAGDGLQALKAEADKLILYCTAQTTITQADAEAIVSRTALSGVFELTDNLAAHNAAQAALVLHRLYQQGEEPKNLHGMIASQYHNILAAKDMTARGFRQQEIASTLGIAPYYAKKCIAQGKNSDYRRLVRALDILLAADYDAMCGRGDLKDLLELAILRICAL